MPIQHLKGLTANDRKLWDEANKNESFFTDPAFTDADRDELYLADRMFDRFSDREDFEQLINMPLTEQVKFFENTPYTNSELEDLKYEEKEFEQPKEVAENVLDSTEDVTNSKPELNSENELLHLADDNSEFKGSRVFKFSDEVADYLKASSTGVSNEEAQIYVNSQKQKREAEDFQRKMEEIKTRFTPEQREEIKENLKRRADEVSSDYKRYKGTDYIPEGSIDWDYLLNNYIYEAENNGDSAADLDLIDSIRATIAQNQSAVDRYGRMATGMGHQFCGSMYQAKGILTNIPSAIAAAADDRIIAYDKNMDDPDLLDHIKNSSLKFIDAVVDNEDTRFGQKIMDTGCLTQAEMDRNAELYGTAYDPTGGNDDQLYTTHAPGSFGLKTFFTEILPEAGQSQGLTVATGVASAGSSMALNALFKSLNYSSKLLVAADKVAKVTKALNTIEGGFTKVNPWVVGSMESVSNGLQTKLKTQNDLAKTALEKHQQEVINLADKLYEEKGNNMFLSAFEDAKRQLQANEVPLSEETLNQLSQNIEQQVRESIFNEANNTLADKLAETQKQIEYDATVAGVNSFMGTMAISGPLNNTLRSGLMAPPVKNMCRNSAFGRKLFGGKQNIIQGADGTLRAENTLGKYYAVKRSLQEVCGEGIEEYGTTITDAVSEDLASYNIEKWLENKYDGDGSMAIGQTYVDGALSKGLGTVLKTGISTEAFEAFYMGALGSAMGTTGNIGNLRLARNAAGNLRLSGIGGMLYRNPVLENFREAQKEKAEADRITAMLNQWLPEAQTRLQKLPGIMGWEHDLKKTFYDGDEFGYRNSTLGKAVNDVMLLNEIQDTELGKAWMNEVQTLANLNNDSEDSELTEKQKELISQVRSDVNMSEEFKDMSDKQVLETIKKNAQNILDMQEKIQAEFKFVNDNTSTVRLPQDAKEAIVFSRLLKADQEERLQKITEELNELTKTLSPEYSAAGAPYEVAKKLFTEELGGTKTLKKLEALESQKVSLEKAQEEQKKKFEAEKAEIFEAQEKLSGEYHSKDVHSEEEKKEYDKSYDELTKQRDAIDAQIKEMTEKAENKKSELLTKIKELKDISDVLAHTVLGQQELMKLDPETRAAILFDIPASSYSAEQEHEIRALHETLLNSGGEELIRKVQDSAKLTSSLRQLNKECANLLDSNFNFSHYIERAQKAFIGQQALYAINKLNSCTSIQDFRKMYSAFMLNKDEMFQSLVSKAVAKNPLFAQIKEQASEFNDFEKHLEEYFTNDETSEVAESDVPMMNLVSKVFRQLQDDNGSLKNFDACIAAIDEKTPEGKYKILDTFSKDMETLSENDPEKIIKEIRNSYINSYNKVIAADAEQSNSSVTVASDPEVPHNIPEQIIEPAPEPVAQEQSKEEQKTIDEQAEKILEATKDLTESSEKVVPEISEEPAEKSPEPKVTNAFDTAQSEEILKNSSKIQTIPIDIYENATGSFATIRNYFKEHNISEFFTSPLYAASNKVAFMKPAEIQPSGDAEVQSAIILMMDVTDQLQKLDPQEAKALADKFRLHREIITLSNNKRVNKFFMPIGLLPSSARKNDVVPGMLRTTPIRKALDNQSPNTLLQDNGKIVLTNFDSHLNQQAPEVSENNNSLNSQFLDTITNDAEKAEIQKAISESSNAHELAKNEVFRKFTQKLLSKLRYKERETKEGKEYAERIVFMSTNPRNGNQEQPFDIRIKDFKNATDVKGNLIWQKFINDSTSDTDIMNSNNYLRRFKNLLTSYTSNLEISKNSDFNKLQEDFNKSLGNLFYLSNALKKAVHLVKTDAGQIGIEIKGVDKKDIDGNAIDNTLFIPLNGNLISEADLYKATRMLLVDDSSDAPTVRTIKTLGKTSDQLYEGSLLKPNVNYHDIRLLTEDPETLQDKDKEKLSRSKDAMLDSVIEHIADGILYTNKSSLHYKVNSVSFYAPYDKDGNLINNPAVPSWSPQQPAKPKTVNSDNASMEASPEKAAPAAGINVQINTDGVVLSGETKEFTNSTLSDTEKKVQEIINGSEKIKLAADEQSYTVENASGETSAHNRTTSVIKYTEVGVKEAEKYKDLDDRWKAPSTVIGTAVDGFIRDFLDWLNKNVDYTVKDRIAFIKSLESKYPVLSYIKKNAHIANTEETLAPLLVELSRMVAGETNTKKSIMAQLENCFGKKAGEFHVVPKDVSLAANIKVKVKKEDGTTEEKSIPVAGTVDLLLYDNEGNFYIVDMKTHRTIDPLKKEKYNEQLSVYRMMLHLQYGIPLEKIRTGVLPINVSYPNPKAEDSYKPGEAPNSLMLKDSAGVYQEYRVGMGKYDFIRFNYGADVTVDEKANKQQLQIPFETSPKDELVLLESSLNATPANTETLKTDDSGEPTNTPPPTIEDLEKSTPEPEASDDLSNFSLDDMDLLGEDYGIGNLGSETQKQSLEESKERYEALEESQKSQPSEIARKVKEVSENLADAFFKGPSGEDNIAKQIEDFLNANEQYKKSFLELAREAQKTELRCKGFWSAPF